MPALPRVGRALRRYLSSTGNWHDFFFSFKIILSNNMKRSESQIPSGIECGRSFFKKKFVLGGIMDK